MRLIIEVNNDEELKQAQSFISSLSISSAKIQFAKKEKIKKLLSWCEQNKFSLESNVILSREERNAR
ncbi:hypothetical protein [Crocosphaera sp.]|uniref:hypothetical protein n=1 Tax=Crocosphaera sp. TaxID=2729996 RepID=UPI002620431E|nr:hypothetical protein [Crocosphaera sp.]MDJ0582339.1 hypothetical protein [Crocosphaera sp.]